MVAFMLMRQVKISRGGQVSIPAEVRHRWKTSRLSLEDRGDEIVLRPQPDDPIEALRGAFPMPPGVTSDDIRRQIRDEETEVEERKLGRYRAP